MKRLLLIIFMLLYAAFARAQGGNALVLTGAGAPAGACSYIMFWVQTSGAFWDCAAGSWNSVSGGGGGGTVTVVASGALTSTAFVTGGGTTTLQTPSATSTLSAGGNASFAGTLAASGHVTFEGVTSAGATGTGNLVFSASPTFTGTLLGAAAVFSTSIATGTAPAACGTATGCYAATEGTASNMTITASQDAFAADATAHAFKMTLNGGAIFLSAMNASLAPTGTIAVSLAGAPAGGKCLQSSGTAGLATEAAGACGSSTPSLDQVTGSAEQATATETAISHEWTYAGIETANLTYPIVFQNTNATNTTSGALAINVVGAGTAMVPLTINQPATDVGNIIQGVNGGTFTSGVLSGGTINWAITSTGAGLFGAATNPTTGTSGGAVAIEGTAFTGTSTNYGWYNDSTLHCFDIIDQTTNIGCAVGEASILSANVIPKASGTTSKIAASSISDNATKVTTSEFFASGNTQRLTADATPITATTPGTIVFTWGALPVSSNWSFMCRIIYNQQSTAVAGDGIAVQGATNAPTRLDAWGKIDITDPASTNYTGSAGSALNITSTTATSVVTATPGAITTVYQAEVNGTIQVGASASTLNILMFTGNASDSVTPKAGSFCTLTP